MKARLRKLFATVWFRVGVAFAIAALVLALVSLAYTPTSQLFLGPSPRLQEQLSFAQVYTGAVAILIAVVLGVFAISEFLQRQSRPRLAILLRDMGSEVLPGGVPIRAIHLVANNTGTDVATWFMVRVRVPFLPQMMTEPIGAGRGLDPVVGVEHSGKDWEHWKESHEGPNKDELWITFLSNGRVGALPDFPLVLGKFLVRPSWFGPEPVRVIYQCPYVLAAERSTLVESVLELDLFELAEGHY